MSRMISDLELNLRDEGTRKAIYDYLKMVKDFQLLGGESNTHRLCYHVAEDFIRVNELDVNCLDYTIGTVKEDDSKTCYIIDVSMKMSDTEWKDIDIAIDKQTMLIRTVFGMDEYVLY